MSETIIPTKPSIADSSWNNWIEFALKHSIKPQDLSDEALHKWEEFIRKIINEERAFACPKCGYKHGELDEQ